MDWLSENVPAAMTAAVALTVAGLGFLFAEGGRRRRTLKRLKEELEVLQLAEERKLPLRTQALWVGMIRSSMSAYARPVFERRYRQAIAAMIGANLLAVGSLAWVFNSANLDATNQADVIPSSALYVMTGVAILQVGTLAWGLKVRADRRRKLGRRHRPAARQLPGQNKGAEES